MLWRKIKNGRKMGEYWGGVQFGVRTEGTEQASMIKETFDKQLKERRQELYGCLGEQCSRQRAKLS